MSTFFQNFPPQTQNHLPNPKCQASSYLIESLSRVNAEEQLPQTVQVLRLMYNATLLHGLTKVGDNTFPNLVALLTGIWVGRRDGKGQEGGQDEDGKKKEINIDRLPEAP